jgi:hypothetical protein
MTGAQVEGVVIPEAVAIEGVMPEAKVPEGAASELEVSVAPETMEEVVVKHGRCRLVAGDPGRGANPFSADVRGGSD